MRVRYGIATDEEKRVFEDWIRAGEEHQALYDKMASDESLKEYLKLKSDYNQATDYGKLHAGILNSLNKRNRHEENKALFLVGRECGCGFARGGNVSFQVYGAFKGCYDKKAVRG